MLEAIRTAIVDKSLPAGIRVTEASLAEQLNVSKTPVREALLELRQAGLIEGWGRRGGRIVVPSVHLIREIVEIREALEVFLAGRVAEIASDADRQSIMASALRACAAAEAGNSDLHHGINLALYVHMANIIDNQAMRDLIEKI